jgi:hypothetical protein
MLGEMILQVGLDETGAELQRRLPRDVEHGRH